MKYRLLGLFCALFVLFDLAATFGQYDRMVLDGDLAAIVHPSSSYAPVLHDPFGLAVLTKDSIYAAPNRFFAHLSMVGYWRAVPGWLQRAGLAPIDSLYAAQALCCTLLQALLLYLLAVYVVGGTASLGNWRLWLAMALLAPFFQAQGYSSEMAIVPQAVTYAFFYPLPLLLLLLLARPFYRWAQGKGWRLGPLGVVGCLGLMVWLAFNGPLVPGVVAVLLLGAGVYWVRTAGPLAGWAPRLRQLPWVPLVLLLVFGLLCAYSLYIGGNNSESLLPKRTVFERYLRLPYGVLRQLTGLGAPLLVLACLGNGYLLRRQVPATAESQRIRQVLRALGWFALVYILLLPLGGYRTYRAYSLRFDTILPITLGLLFFYGLSALYLLRHLAGHARTGYAVGLVVIAGIYANADRKLHVADGNDCERAALVALGQAPAEVPAVHLEQGCNVLSWYPITEPAASADQAAMLHYWGITWGLRPFYQ